MVIIGIDPGKRIGVAWVHEDGRLEQASILSLADLEQLALSPQACVVVGDGTGSQIVQRTLSERQVAFTLVDERDTTLKARVLYFAAHPPVGLRRLLPRGLWFPPRPIDDYAAYAIALRYLEKSRGEDPPARACDE